MKRWLPWMICFATCVAAAITIGLLWLQSKKLRESNAELEYNVDAYCRHLKTELQVSSTNLSKGLEILTHPELSPEQRARAEQAFDLDLPLGAGITDAHMGGRASASLALSNWFGFCSGIREVNEPRRDAVQGKFSEVTQRFRESSDRKVVAAAVAAMAEAAEEVSSWPLLQRRRPGLGE